MNTENWYQQQERGAGSFRLNLLFFVYKIFGIRFIKFLVRLVAGVLGASAKSAKTFSCEYKQILNGYQIAHGLKPTKFSSAQHIRSFADSLVDKMIAMCDKKNRIKFVIQKDSGWCEFQELVKKKQGAFLICSHLGNIEALAALPDGAGIKIHAFQQIGQSGIFHGFITRRSVRANTIIHPVEDMNVGTATQMFDFLENGDLVMMAGDRISAANPTKTVSVRVLERDCELPMGVFRFAKSMSHPVFAIFLLNIGHEKYKLFVKKLDNQNATKMANEFASVLERAILSAPTQWFNFYKFFQDK
ncbi:MAG: hypothetical protein K5912_04170 [Alphaproteobacteria bacterium]|nr:hypothetical protein [Alphaproteobacteria bacterium]